MFRLLNADSFDEMYAIMEASFPRSERRSREAQRALFADAGYKVCAEADDDGRLRAFMAYWELNGVTFLEHFAVRPALRGAGTGGRFLDGLMLTLALPVVLEVEPPDGGIASRRIAFYERHGFVLNDYEYIQPPLGEGQPTLPLKIMSYKCALGREQFEAVRKEIYESVYKILAK